MIGPVVFNFEKVFVLLDRFNRFGVVPEPAGGDEDCGVDLVVNQGLQDALVNQAAASIKSEGNMRSTRLAGVDGKLWFNQFLAKGLAACKVGQQDRS